MSKLIAVEFSPKIIEERSPLASFYGCVGETLDTMLSQEWYKEGLPKSIPVRFPLSMPNSSLTFHLRGRDVIDPYTLREEGVLINTHHIHPLDRTPVSLYKREALVYSKDCFSKLFESDTYSSTYNIQTFFEVLESLGRMYNNGWLWKKEWDNKMGDPTKKSIFIEARLYGIDSIISLYDKKTFGGVAIEVIVRPWPRKDDSKAGIKISRLRSNVYIASNQREYIEYLDGIKIPRKNIAPNNESWSKAIAKTYANLQTPRGIKSSLRKQNS